jgi:hypothetical protein
MKNRQHQHKCKPHPQEKFQGAAMSVEDAIIKIRGFNLCGAHCIDHGLACCKKENFAIYFLATQSFTLSLLYAYING